MTTEKRVWKCDNCGCYDGDGGDCENYFYISVKQRRILRITGTDNTLTHWSALTNKFEVGRPMTEETGEVDSFDDDEGIFCSSCGVLTDLVLMGINEKLKGWS